MNAISDHGKSKWHMFHKIFIYQIKLAENIAFGVPKNRIDFQELQVREQGSNI